MGVLLYRVVYGDVSSLALAVLRKKLMTKQDSLDASVVFGEAIVKNGWSRSHQVRILLNFIGKSGYTQSLKDYLNEKQKDGKDVKPSS